MLRDNVLPVIVPRTYFQYNNWPGHYKFLKHPQLAITWVETSKPGSMLYINVEDHKKLEASGQSVHELAMQNLRKAGALTTHEKVVEGQVIFRAMMHADGLGTSRLLLLPELARLFPGGYLCGIPERSCGVVVPRNLPNDSHSQVLQMVNGCYEEGTTPMLSGIFESDQFEVVDA